MRVAEIREAEGDRAARPEFRFAINPQTGQKDFHILVRHGKAMEDPSRRLGMEQYHRQRGIWMFPS